MKSVSDIKDPDLRATWPAMQRAAKRALALAKETNTSCFVMVDGKIVDLNPPSKRRGRKPKPAPPFGSRAGVRKSSAKE